MNDTVRTPRNRLPRVMACAIASPIGVVAAFWVYSSLRTLTEHVGFDPGASAIPALFTIIAVCVAAALAIVVAMALRVRPIVWRGALLALFAGGLAGLAGAEGYILADERAFAREAAVAEASGAAQFARSRAWPNALCSLVWNKGQAIHATD